MQHSGRIFSHHFLLCYLSDRKKEEEEGEEGEEGEERVELVGGAAGLGKEVAERKVSRLLAARNHK